MDGTLNPQQIDWMKTLPKRSRLMVLSHHQGFDISGHNPNGLYTQVCDALGRVPDYWYWGHLHNGIVYAEQGGLKARCAGHGAIPYGVTSELDGMTGCCFPRRAMPATRIIRSGCSMAS